MGVSENRTLGNTGSMSASGHTSSHGRKRQRGRIQTYLNTKVRVRRGKIGHLIETGQHCTILIMDNVLRQVQALKDSSASENIPRVAHYNMRATSIAADATTKEISKYDVSHSLYEH